MTALFDDREAAWGRNCCISHRLSGRRMPPPADPCAQINRRKQNKWLLVDQACERPHVVESPATPMADRLEVAQRSAPASCVT